MSRHPLHSLPAAPTRTASYRGIAAITQVHTARGGIPAQELRPGDRLSSAPGTSVVTAVRPPWLVPVVCIRHRFGELRLPADQEVRIFTGLHTWRSLPARLLAPGDRLVWDPSGYDGMETTLPAMLFPEVPPSAHAWPITIPELDPEIAWLLGYIAGNGTVFVPPQGAKSRTGALSISCPLEAPELVDRVVTALRRFGVDPKITPGDGKLVRVMAYASNLAHYLWTWFKRPNTPIAIPSWIRDAPRVVRAAYLAGVFDSDGSAETRPLELCSSVYPSFLAELQRLYASLGIATERKQCRAAIDQWQALSRLTTKGIENRTAVAAALGPHSLKHRAVKPLLRAGHGFDFPTPLVRAELVGTDTRWLTSSPAQSVARLQRRGGIVLQAYPLAVEAITFPEERLIAVELVVAGGGELIAEGIVLAMRDEAVSRIAVEVA